MTVGRLRQLVVPTLLTFIVVAGFVSLGNWQMRRLAWKQDLVAMAGSRPDGPVAPLPAASDWPQLDAAELQYRPFLLSGRYDPDGEALVFTSLTEPRGKYGGPGYWVMTPFRLVNGGTVWVNRGFIPQDRRNTADYDQASAAPRTLTGLLRPDDPRSMYTPEDSPDTGIFYRRDVAALSAAMKPAEPVAPFTVDLLAGETPPSGLPQAGETRMAFTNSHLQYALTWYGLALAAAGVFLALAIARLRAGALTGSDAAS